MKLSAIMCCDINGVIGCSDTNSMPWYVPLDLRLFKRLTMGHHVIMGYRTYLSLDKPLGGRVNHILSNKHIPFENTSNTLDDALFKISYSGAEQAFLIGGGSTFDKYLSRVNKVYLTVLEASYRGDIYMPNIIDAGLGLSSEVSETCCTSGVVCNFQLWERF